MHRKRESSSSKIRVGRMQSIWQHEWTSPKLLLSNGNIGVHQIIRGPFQSPQLIRASPCVLEDLSRAENAEERKIIGIRRGIPNPWNEYLALRGFCGEHDRKTVRRHLKLGCDSVRLTEAVWKNLGLSLAQGIPDPWKDCPYNTESFVTNRSNHSSRQKTRIKLKGASADPGDSYTEPWKKINDKFKEKVVKMKSFQENMIKDQGQDPKENLKHEAKVSNCKSTQTIFFDGDPTTRLRRKKKFSNRNRRIVNVRCPYQPSRLNSEVNIQPEKSNSTNDGTSKKKSVIGFVYSRARILDENVKNKKIQVHNYERRSNYPCRVCQPEVTPTRHSNAVIQQQENFWRCTRHQPGSSYRLESSNICGRRREIRESEKLLGVAIVEPENSIEPYNNSWNLGNEKAVSCNTMKRLLRGWREKGEEILQDVKSWYPNVKNSAQINLVCCQCSCPYLRTNPCLDYEKHISSKDTRRQICKKYICIKCRKRRERRTNAKNYSNHGESLKKSSSTKTHQSVAEKNDASVSNKGQADNPLDASPLGDNEVNESSSSSSKRAKNSRESFENKPDIETFEKFSVKPVTSSADNHAKRLEKTEAYGNEKIVRYASSDSGTYADISDASRKTNYAMESASVTSSTFIHRMKDNPKQMKTNKSHARDLRDSPIILVVSTRRGVRRGKRRYVLDRSSDETLKTCLCLDPRCNSEFKKIDESIAEQKHVTYQTTDNSRGAEDNANLSIESSEALENIESLDKSSSNVENEKKTIDETSKKIKKRQQLESLSERTERSCSILEGLSTFKRPEIRSFSDVGPVEKNLLMKNKVLRSEDDVRDKSGDPRALRRRRVASDTAEGISNMQFKSTAVLASNSRSLEDPIEIQTNDSPRDVNRSEFYPIDSQEAEEIEVRQERDCGIEKISVRGTGDSREDENALRVSVPEPSYVSTDIECSEAHGFDNWNVGDKYEEADDSKKYEMLLPFQKEISHQYDQNNKTDDLEIEDLVLQNNISCLERLKNSRDIPAPVSMTKNIISGFFSNNDESHAPNCYTKFCAERKSVALKVEEELILKSCSETEEGRIDEIES